MAVISIFNYCERDNEFPLNNRWCQYGLVSVSQYQLGVRWAMRFWNINVIGVYYVCVVWSCVVSLCAYHRTPAVSTIGSDLLLGAPVGV